MTLEKPNKEDKIALNKILSAKREKEERQQKRREYRKEREKLKATFSDFKYNILEDYLRGISIPDLSTSYSFPEREIQDYLDMVLKGLLNRKEERILSMPNYEGNPQAQELMQQMKKWEIMTDSFFSLLSPPTGALTEEEALFCFSLVHEGDYGKALETSGLSEGLLKNREGACDSKVAYPSALKYRYLYLMQKENVANYIQELREQKFLVSNVDKTRVMTEVVDLIDTIKKRGDRKDTNSLLKAIELLGKGVGAWVERVEVTEINPGDSLDRLIEMAKKATVEESRNSSYLIEANNEED